VNLTCFSSRRESVLIRTALIAAAVACAQFVPATVHAQNTISTIAGGATPPSAPLSADIPGPRAAVKDASGNIYIAAPASSYIFKVTPGGTLTTAAGVGYGGFAGDGGPATAATVANPAAFAFDSAGNFYFADPGNSRIRKISASTGIISTVAGSGDKCAHSTNTCGDGGLATAALLNLPESVAIDSGNNIFIADATDNRIRRVDAGTGIITTIAGTGDSCTNPTSACGDGAAATAAQLNFPEGVAFDAAGNLYIADTFDHRIRIIPAHSTTINAFAGNGGACLNSLMACGDGNVATNSNLRRPQNVAADSAGNIYIADTLDNRIRMVSAATSIITTVAGNGIEGFAGDGGSATIAYLNLPVGISVDSAGNLLISDTGNQRVRQVNLAGTISTIAGGGTGGDGGLAANATLAGPFAIAEDPAGNYYYIVDQANNRIRRVSRTSGIITTVAGNGTVGYSGDLGAATSATFNVPTSVVIDSANNMYIADSNNLVIRRVDGGSGIITTYAGNGNSCFPTTSACGDGGPATSATFAEPLSLALDSAGNLYIADYFGHRIRKVDATTHNISTVAGTGNEGKKGDGGLATQAYLDHPAGVAVDSQGRIYISDQYNNRIRRVDTNGIINPFALNTAAKLAGNGGPALNGSMWNPMIVVLDPSNNLFISGGNDNVVQRVSAATGIYSTVAGNPSKASVGGFSGDGGPATSARMANVGSSVDGQGNLYIADQGNNRIRYVLLTPAATAPTSPLNFGSVPLNTTSVAKTATFKSVGGGDVNLTGISISGTGAAQFAQTNTCGSLPALLSPYQQCTVSVTFTPNTYGKKTATLNFTDNITGGPQTVNLSGSGPDFSISASPTSFTVTRGQSGSSTITLAPIAQFNQTISLTCTGAPANSTCSVSPNSVTLDGTNNGSATVTLQTTSSTPTGTFTITIKGAFVPLQHPVSIKVTVQ